ncbi:MAG TPA: hypothetical protein IAA33_00680 [Candidatus Helicobacter avicola]|nr:hypothetical protein [Candidatus Helicobacter avicola]
MNVIAKALLLFSCFVLRYVGKFAQSVMYGMLRAWLLIVLCVCAIHAYPQEESTLTIRPPKLEQDFEYGGGDERGRNSNAPYTNPKDGKYFFGRYAPSLQAVYEKLEENSANGQYARFSRRILIGHKAYDALDKTQKSKLQGALVLSRVYISAFLKYSELGGVGIGGKFSPADEQDRYFSVDSRYFSDLQELGVDHLIYLLCVLPRFDKCLVLGIGEEF